MNSIVLELQHDAMASGLRVSDLLRKALVVAKKLGLFDFREWIECELEGYKKGAKIPEHRTISGEIRAWNPYHGWIPVIFEDPKFVEKLTKREIGQPIGEIESLLEKGKGKGFLQVPFQPEVEGYLMKKLDIPLRPTLRVGEHEIHGIIDAVRNTILNWALKLEEEGILGTGITFSGQEKAIARESTTITIHNFQGILGDVQQSTVSQNLNMSINKNDFKSLSEYLGSIGIVKDDIESLRKALESDLPPSSSGQFGEHVSNWIGKMISKAASGAWQVSVGAAGGLLGKALAAYFGIS